MEQDDAEIVESVLAGNRAAFGILIDRHEGAVRGLALRILRARADAEDVAQEAFLHAFLDLAKLRSHPRFSAWVLGIAVHLAKSRLRARREEPIEDWAGGRALPFAWIDPEPTPEARQEERELHDQIWAALASLPLEQRQAVRLHYVEGLRVWEIAALVGLPAGTVKARLHRARERLRRALAAEGGRMARPSAHRKERVVMVEMTVDDVVARAPKEGEVRWFDPVRGSNLGRWRVVLLKERQGERVLPIWVGGPEAGTIAMQLAGIKTPRPMTLTLLTQILTLAAVAVERVIISALRDNIFYASLVLRIGGEPREVDARPSDAIAVALESRAPIFATPDLLALPCVVTSTTVLASLDRDLDRKRQSLALEPEVPEMRWISFRSAPDSRRGREPAA